MHPAVGLAQRAEGFINSIDSLVQHREMTPSVAERVRSLLRDMMAQAFPGRSQSNSTVSIATRNVTPLSASVCAVPRDGNSLFSACVVALAGKVLTQDEIKQQAAWLRAAVVEYIEMHLEKWRVRESVGLRELVRERWGVVNAQGTHRSMEAAISTAINEYNTRTNGGMCPTAIDEYLNMISQDRGWAGHLELKVISKLHDVDIMLHTSASAALKGCVLEGPPARNGAIHLAWNGRDHYDAYYTGSSSGVVERPLATGQPPDTADGSPTPQLRAVYADQAVDELIRACDRMRLVYPDGLPQPLAPLPPQDAPSQAAAEHTRVHALFLPLLRERALAAEHGMDPPVPLRPLLPAAALGGVIHDVPPPDDLLEPLAPLPRQDTPSQAAAEHVRAQLQLLPPLQHAVASKKRGAEQLERALCPLVPPEAIDSDGDTPLHTAAREGDLAAVQRLLKGKANCNAVNDSQGRTPLHYASRNGHKAIVGALLAAGASPKVADAYGATPLHFAANEGHLDIVLLLLGRRADCDATENGTTPLHLASERGRTAVIEALLNAGADVNSPMPNGVTPLHLASNHGHPEAVRLLLARGAKCNALSSKNCAALHYASEKNHDDVAHILLRAGAIIDAKTALGSTALHLAARQGHLAAVRLLIAFHAACDGEEEASLPTPLCCASAGGYIAVMYALIKAGAAVNRPNGLSALHAAAKGGHVDAVRLLLARGANRDAVAGAHACTALHMASEEGQVAVIEILLNAGTPVNITEGQGATPLYFAAHNGHLGALQLLLARGADPNPDALGSGGYTPLQMVSRAGRADMAKALLDAGARVNACTASPSRATALHFASSAGQPALVEVLLNAGAHVNATIDDGGTALHVAIQSNSLDSVRLLIAHGADVHAVYGPTARTPLRLARALGNAAIERILLNAIMVAT